jgi:Ran GTPase-activating protein (RanGAP) involved in mRNA processing and transport
MTNALVYQTSKLQDLLNNCRCGSRIDLRKQILSDSDMELVINQAIVAKQCKMLWLKDNRLTSRGVSLLLASMLKSNIALEGLSLASNSICDHDLIQLVNILSMNTSKLNRLALTSNKITDSGVPYLAQMLKLNRTLTQLWLGYNEITDQGVHLLTETLANHNQTLQVLSLSANTMVTDASIDSFLQMLEHNRTLKVLALVGCHLSDTCKSQLRQAAKLHGEFYFDF